MKYKTRFIYTLSNRVTIDFVYTQKLDCYEREIYITSDLGMYLVLDDDINVLQFRADKEYLKKGCVITKVNQIENAIETIFERVD